MKRTLVQLDDRTYRRLRQRAFDEERSMSAVVRDLLARGLETGTEPDQERRRQRFLSVGAGRSPREKSGPVSERHDAALTRVLRP